jgi:hypothetical protein
MPPTLTIPDHQIVDVASFGKVTDDPRRIAAIYFYFVLDCLVDLAHRVANDFFARPELFTDLPDGAGGSVAPVLARMHARYGSDEEFLDKTQRGALYAGLFGTMTSDDPPGREAGNFAMLRDELLMACATFVETKFGDEGALRENVRQKHRLLKEYLTGLDGDSLTWSRDDALGPLAEDTTYRILRNPGVAAVYGIAKAPRAEWPCTFDANADKLVEKVSMYFQPPSANGDAAAMPTSITMPAYISREEITNRQRTALEGAQAIATVIDVAAGSNDADIDLMIRKCYTWATALHALTRRSPDSVRGPVPSRGVDHSRAEIAVAQPLVGSFTPANGT